MDNKAVLTKQSTLNMPHDEWLKIRKSSIGGSDAGAILGLSPYKSAFDVYADKVGISSDKPDNEAMRQGRDLEEYVAQRFTEQTGKRVRRENSIIHNSDYPYSHANIDRAVIGEKAGLECKTTKCLNLKRYKNGDFPSEYYCQCVHYLMVTGLERWYLAVLVFGTDFMIFTIERDEAEIAALAESEQRFWEENVQKKVPPSPDGAKSTDELIGTMYPNDNGGNCDLSLFAKELDLLHEVKKKLSEYETEKRRLEQEIKLYMKDSDNGFCGDYSVTWKAQQRSSFDVSALIEDFVPEGTDLTEYYKSTKYRVFKVKEK